MAMEPLALTVNRVSKAGLPAPWDTPPAWVLVAMGYSLLIGLRWAGEGRVAMAVAGAMEEETGVIMGAAGVTQADRGAMAGVRTTAKPIGPKASTGNRVSNSNSLLCKPGSRLLVECKRVVESSLLEDSDVCLQGQADSK